MTARLGWGRRDCALPVPPRCFWQGPSVARRSQVLLDAVIILKYCALVFLRGSICFSSTLFSAGYRARIQNRTQRRETHSPFSQGAHDPGEGQVSYETASLI